MEWTQEDKVALLSFKNYIDSDDIKIKEEIKKQLLNNRFIIHVLNNEQLEEVDAEPDEYFGVNIFPYYIIKDTQTDVRNYLCYTVGYKELERYNKCEKYLQITFIILCEQKNIIDSDTGVARHDLLAALIQDQFNYSNYFGGRPIQLISDLETVVDTNYACRTLVFEQITDNNLVKTYGNQPRLINKYDTQSRYSI